MSWQNGCMAKLEFPFLMLIKGLYFIHRQIYLINNNFELKGTSLSLAFEDFLGFVQIILQTWAS